MELVKSALAESAKGRDGALRAYGDLLAQSGREAGDDDGKAGRRLQKLIDALGKTPADVEADLRIVQRAAALRTHIAAGPDAVRRAAERRRAVHDYDAETKQLLHERREGYRSRYAAMSDADAAHVRAMAAVSEFDRLAAQHPVLLGADADE